MAETADPVALLVHGRKAEINIGSSGELVSMIGLKILGNAARLENSGRIEGSTNHHGLLIDHVTGGIFRNSGLIAGGDGILSSDSWSNTIVNEADGRIRGDYFGVNIVASYGADTRIVNHGVISGASAIQAEFGDVDITNRGIIKGDVVLGAGADRLDTRGGTISGLIFGGYGADTLLVDDAESRLFEAEAHAGLDTVKSTVSYRLTDGVEQLILLGTKDIRAAGTADSDILHGNAGANRIAGLDGIDHLYGEKGNDLLFGGLGTDVFHFDRGDGHDTIVDLHAGGGGFVEIIDWNGIDNFRELKRHARDRGDDVLISSGEDSILIKGASMADLRDHDFLF